MLSSLTSFRPLLNIVLVRISSVPTATRADAQPSTGPPSLAVARCMRPALAHQGSTWDLLKMQGVGGDRLMRASPLMWPTRPREWSPVSHHDMDPGFLARLDAAQPGPSCRLGAAFPRSSVSRQGAVLLAEASGGDRYEDGACCSRGSVSPRFLPGSGHAALAANRGKGPCGVGG